VQAKISTDAKFTASLAQISGRWPLVRLAPDQNRMPAIQVFVVSTEIWIILGAGEST